MHRWLPAALSLMPACPDAVPSIVHDSEGFPGLACTRCGHTATQRICFLWEGRARQEEGRVGVWMMVRGRRGRA